MNTVFVDLLWEARLTARKLAELTAVHESLISRYKRGLEPPLETAKKLCAALANKIKGAKAADLLEKCWPALAKGVM